MTFDWDNFFCTLIAIVLGLCIIGGLIYIVAP